MVIIYRTGDICCKSVVNNLHDKGTSMWTKLTSFLHRHMMLLYRCTRATNSVVLVPYWSLSCSFFSVVNCLHKLTELLTRILVTVIHPSSPAGLLCFPLFLIIVSQGFAFVIQNPIPSQSGIIILCWNILFTFQPRSQILSHSAANQPRPPQVMKENITLVQHSFVSLTSCQEVVHNDFIGVLIACFFYPSNYSSGSYSLSEVSLRWQN